MGNKITAKLAGICVGGLLLAMPMSASADTYHSLLNQKGSIVQQKQQVKSELDKINAKVNQLTGQISDSQIEIGKTKDEIDSLNKNIAETQKRINERQSLLKDRVVASYKNGSSTNVLELLLGAKSFGDFINRAVAIYNITDHDNEIIQKQIADQNLLETQQQKVKDDLAKSQDKLKELNQLVAKVETIQSQKQAALNGLNSKESKINSSLKSVLASSATPKRSNSGSSSSNGISQMSYIPSNIASGTVSDMVHAASRYIGNSDYVFGAMDPAHGRFDCSGFVNWAYQQIGVNLGSRSTSGLQYVGSPVSRGDLQPGDLVFFDTYKHNGHVAIYLGGGQFLGSQTSTGVAYASINDPYYWGPRYSMARRVLH